jgi:excisionase family DNA binding protein
MMTMTEIEARPDERQVLDISEFCHAYHISRPSFYREVKAGRLRAVRMGKKVLIPLDAAKEWFETLPVLSVA